MLLVLIRLHWREPDKEHWHGDRRACDVSTRFRTGSSRPNVAQNQHPTCVHRSVRCCAVSRDKIILSKKIFSVQTCLFGNVRVILFVIIIHCQCDMVHSLLSHFFGDYDNSITWLDRWKVHEVTANKSGQKDVKCGIEYKTFVLIITMFILVTVTTLYINSFSSVSAWLIPALETNSCKT